MINNEDMKLSIGIVKKHRLVTNNWTGGTTTQLLVYPENGDYGKRDFKWRVSTAKVEAQESTFTSLPGISRIIMILQGSLKLEHDEHPGVELNEYEAYTFNGEWATRSFGKVIDFNLMMSEGVKGELGCIRLKSFQNEIIVTDGNESYKDITHFYYCPYKSIRIMNNDDEYKLNAGEIIYITSKKMKIELRFFNDSEEDIIVVSGKVLY